MGRVVHNKIIQNSWWGALALLVFAIQVLRFVGLEQAPTGFYIDEAVGSAQVLCLKQSDVDLFGEIRPLFPKGLGAGFYTPTYVAFQKIWTSIFGPSVAAFRSGVAAITTLTLLVFSLGIWAALGGWVAFWFLVLGSISPWSWQFSRIAWDPPLAPLGLVLGLSAWWLFQARRPLTGAVGLGLGFAIAAYSYPPTRLQVGLMLVLFPLWSGSKNWKHWVTSGVTAGVAMIPLVIRGMDEDFRARGNLVGVWSDYSGNPYAGHTLFELAWDVVVQMAQHLSPQFLWISGDANLRHSTQAFGMMSWIEGAVIVVGLSLLKHASVRGSLLPREKRAIGLAVLGVLTGILPAALTWESVPHALRSITAWPFLSLGGAIVLGLWTVRLLAQKKSLLYLGLCAVSCFAFSTAYLRDYFFEYPERSKIWFQTEDHALTRKYQELAVGGSCHLISK